MAKYLTCDEASKQLNVTPRRTQQLCKDGDISGAIKKGHKWLIPEDYFLCSTNTKLSLPIGVSDFKIATFNYYYVDKTLLIRDFLDTKSMVSLFTRPRRFGKTLNMDMLRVFFEKTEVDTSIYFKDKKIWKCGNQYKKYQGQYPVIFLTFKDIKCLTWDDTFNKIRKLVSLEFIRHNELENSPNLNEYEKEQYRYFASGHSNEVDTQMALQLLSLLLHKHYQKECIIIIDEYDTPIEQGHNCNFYNEIIYFMRNFFSGGLKDNSHLAYGFLTGILRIAKESIFSGMNNLKIYSILDDKFSEYFGFTVEEVKDMLHYYGKDDKFKEICNWYDGYQFGSNEIFNPWSVINYISDDCFPKAFWESTGSNEIIGEILSSATPQIIEDLQKLLCGEAVTTYIDTSVIYPEVQNNPYTIYSFLLVAGYLKVSSTYPQNDGNYMCTVSIPNKEIAYVYEKEILNHTKQNNIAISISQAIFTQDCNKLQSLLEEFMMNSISYFDSANESFYHGMILGLCAILSNRYKILSNRESGLGRFDIALCPLSSNLPGFIFEFKHTKDKTIDLNLLANQALEQINVKKYDTELHGSNIHSIIKIGIAFRGKDAVVISNN